MGRKQDSERYPEERRRWGRKKTMVSLLLTNPKLIDAVDKRAEKLSKKLGYKINRHQVIEELIANSREIKKPRKKVTTLK